MTDPSRPLPPLPTQEQINYKLVWVGEQMRHAKENLRQAMRLKAEKVRDATVVEATSFIEGTGAMDLRKWQARLVAADAQYEVGCADAEVEAAKTALFNLRDELNAAQTMSANIRSEVQLERSTPNVPQDHRMRVAS